MPFTRSRSFIALFFVLFLLSLQLLGDENQVKKILSSIEKKKESQFWKESEKLAKLGLEESETLEKLYPSVGPKAKLSIIRYFIENGERKKGLDLLKKWILRSDLPLSLRKMGLVYLEQIGEKKEDVKGLERLLEEPGVPVEIKILGAKLLRKIGKSSKGRRYLKRYLRSSNFQIQLQAAIALAEIGNPSFKVRKILEKAAKEPTPQGKYARLLLENMKLFDQLAKTQGLTPKMQLKALEKKIEDLKKKNKELKLAKEANLNTGKALLDEILDKIERYYDFRNPKEIDKKRLIEAAAKGILDSLDPHSVYFNTEETKRFQESMSSKYPGIGAYVQKNSRGYLKISQPIYSGPAYKAGLRSGDIVTEIMIDKKWVKTTKYKLQELVNRLRGPAGTQVRLKVWRKGWEKPKEFAVYRQFVKIPLVYYSMMPGKIGYIQLTSFGEKCSQEIEKALKELEKQGMAALVLDLRNNPGGYLHEAVKIADFFIRGKKLIVFSKGRNPMKAPKREYFSHTEGTHPDLPLVVLVNSNSASASEILSGALKLHKRAILIGTKTYGKGSVQELMPLRSMGGKAMVKLTIAKYYLPDGSNIDHKGIMPHIVVKPESLSDQEGEAYVSLLQNEKLDQYLDQYYP
ncbi:MAG: PDZ domain-containing protein, partial [Planctomycetota bacterium]